MNSTSFKNVQIEKKVYKKKIHNFWSYSLSLVRVFRILRKSPSLEVRKEIKGGEDDKILLYFR